MIAAAYAAAATLAAPLLRRRLRRRAAIGKEVSVRLAERWGEDVSPRPDGTLLWLHAASVGETVSILPVLQSLAEQAPATEILLTTGTVTSAQLLAHRLPALGMTRVRHRFAPLDVPGWVARFLDHWRPDAAGFVESELWPNLIAACRARAIPMALVNARLSRRSLAGWRRAPDFARLNLSAFDMIVAQSQSDAARLAELAGRDVDCWGNLKLAAETLPADPAEWAQLHHRLAGRPVWLAASTHPGEEDIVLAAHATLLPGHPGLLTIIAPRHPERGRTITADAWRSRGQSPPEGAGVYVADTIGELGLFYRLADAVFVGGSLVPHGGQNVLEPARLGCPVAVGPHTGNFDDATALLEASGALARVNAASLAGWVAEMLADPGRRARMGAAAAEAVRGDPTLPGRIARALLDLAGRR